MSLKETTMQTAREAPSAPTYAKVRRLFGGLVRAVYRLEVVGADRLPATGPAVVAPNHESFLDGIVLGAAISRELRFLAKAELWRSRLLAWALDGLGAIPIERGHSDYLAAVRVLQTLAAGQAVVIFPQGAVRGDRVWKQGAAHAALVTGAPLVPVRLVARHGPSHVAKSASRSCVSSSESRSKSRAPWKDRLRLWHRS